MRTILGWISIPIVFILGLYFLGVGVLGMIDGGEMNVPLLPFETDNTARSVLIMGIVVMFSAVMAQKNSTIARLPLMLVALAMTLVLVTAFFRSDYLFDGMDGLKQYGWNLLGSFLLLVCTWFRLRTVKKTDGLGL